MKFSVIMPVYGVERYLDESVACVLGQTYKDFELILVDDCSPDNCPAMCDEWAKKDSRVRVIHKPQNEGLGFARNTGMAAARGEYVLFMDSDDGVEPQTLSVCAAAMDASGADITVFGVTCVYENKRGKTNWTETLLPRPMTARSDGEKAELFTALNEARIFPFAWNKVYRRSFLQQAGVQFESTKLIEDFLFNIALLPMAARVDTLPEALYRYRRPAHETLVSKYHPEFFDLCKRKYGLELDFLTACGAKQPGYAQRVMDSFLRHFLSVIIRNRSKSARLSLRDRLALTRRMLADPVTRSVLTEYKPTGLKMKAIAFAMSHRMALLCECTAAAAQLAQSRLLVIYKKYLIK